MYTSHGHHIWGTPKAVAPPLFRARCGGVPICASCMIDATRAWIEAKAHLEKLAEPQKLADEVDHRQPNFD